MILADSSAWIEYDRASGSSVDARMTMLIAQDGPLAITEPVIMEVLAGARDDRREADLYNLLVRFELLPIEPATDFLAAAHIYRRCRQAGVTPPGLIDALIAAVAWRHGADVLTTDVDLIRVTGVMDSSIDPPTPD